jgi:hypothetical protein
MAEVNESAAAGTTGNISVEAFGEALTAALTSGRVIEALYQALMPTIEKAIREAVDVAVTELVIKLDDRETELATLRRRVEDLEAYSRVDNVIVYGLKEATAEVVTGASHDETTVPATGGESSGTSEKVFIDFCRTHLRVDIHPSDISVAHRLGKTNRARGPNPMIVRFSNRKAKLRVLAARKELRAQESCRTIFINEHLTATASSLFAKARAAVKQNLIQKAWTYNGRIFVRTLPDNGGRSVLITHQTDLSCL